MERDARKKRKKAMGAASTAKGSRGVARLKAARRMGEKGASRKGL